MSRPVEIPIAVERTARLAREPAPRRDRPPGAAREPVETRCWTEHRLGGVPLLVASYRAQRFARHRHERFEIAINQRGSHSLCYRGTTHRVPPGCLLVISPGEPHDGGSTGGGPWVYRAIFPDPAMLAELAGETTSGGGLAFGFPQLLYPDRGLARSFLAAHQGLAQPRADAAAEAAMRRCLALLVSRYARRAAAEPAAPEKPLVARCRQFIETHIGQRITLEEIAGAARASRFHLHRSFRRELGLTPHEYLMQRRIDRAQELLRQGGGLSSAAQLLGFADQSHLTREFKRLVGVTPGEFVRGCVPPRAERAGTAGEQLALGRARTARRHHAAPGRA